jgi:hypothetical protein
MDQFILAVTAKVRRGTDKVHDQPDDLKWQVRKARHRYQTQFDSDKIAKGFDAQWVVWQAEKQLLLTC